MRLDEELHGRHRQRSAWICSAIDSKLRGDFDDQIEHASTRRLMAVLLARDDVDEHLKEEILRRLKGN